MRLRDRQPIYLTMSLEHLSCSLHAPASTSRSEKSSSACVASGRTRWQQSPLPIEDGPACADSRESSRRAAQRCHEVVTNLLQCARVSSHEFAHALTIQLVFPTEWTTAMPDTILPLPVAPDGVDAASHLRSLLVRARAEAADATGRLHLEPPRCLRDDAAAASTALRELRRIAQYAIDDDEVDEEALLALLTGITIALEAADQVLMSVDLRRALAGDLDGWEQVRSEALSIGELAGSGYVGFAVHDVRDHERLARVEHRAEVPIVHAI